MFAGGDGFTSLFPERQRSAAKKLAAEVTETAITGLVVAALSAIVGFKLPWVLFGMAIAIVIGTALAAPQGVWITVSTVVVVLLASRFSDNFVVPKIMGQKVGISPVGIMFAVFAGGELFGFVGLLLAVPAVALLKVLWRYFGAEWLSEIESDTA